MPLLFISYKRGTEGIDTFMQRLKQEGYALWFDKYDIKVGDHDWQEAIYRGVKDSDALVLCLTEDAAQSEYVQDEVNKALQKEEGKPNSKIIFPILFQENLSGERIAELLEEVGLHDKRQCEDLSMSHGVQWNSNFNKLLGALRLNDITPSRYDIRMNDPHSEDYRQTARYLSYIGDVHKFTSVDYKDNQGKVRSEQIEVDKLFVPPPTEFRLIMQIKDYDVTRWWLSKDMRLPEGISDSALSDERIAEFKQEHDLIMLDVKRTTVDDDDWNQGVLQSIIQNRREELYHQAQQDRYRRLGRLDDVYEVKCLTAIQMVALCKRLVLWGEPGSGKRLFGKYLTTMIAGQLRYHVEKSDWLYQGLTPVHINMQTLAEFLDDRRNEHGWTASGLLQYLKQHLTEISLEQYYTILEHDLYAGMGVLIFNDVDTIFSEQVRTNTRRSAKLEELFSSIQERFKAIPEYQKQERTSFKKPQSVRIVILSRPIKHYHEPKSFLTAHFAPLSPHHRDQLLHKFFSAIGRSEEHLKISISDIQAELKTYEDDNNAHHQGLQVPVQSELASKPSFIRLLAKLHPTKYGLLYKEIVSGLIESAVRNKSGIDSLDDLFNPKQYEEFYEDYSSSEIALLQLLSKLAYDSLSQDRVGDELRAMLLSATGELALEYESNATDLFAFITQDIGIFTTGTEFKFASESFRQYLAAEYVMVDFIQDINRQKDDAHTLLRDLIETDPYRWQECARIIGDLLTEITDVLDVIDDMVDDNIPDGSDISSDDPKFYSVWFAARIAVDQADKLDTSKLSRLMREAIDGALKKRLRELSNWLKLMLDTLGSPRLRDKSGDHKVDLRIRSESGRLLGRLGDDRSGVGCVEGVPDIHWVTIPADHYMIGTVEGQEASPGELPCAEIKLDQFEIAKHPITVSQYEAFVDAGGYDEANYWHPLGWEWRHERKYPSEGWKNLRWHVGNHPIIGVTWYEAGAFCNWLNSLIADEDWLIRLPDELEWEVAARGKTNNIFPYASVDCRPEWANGRLTNINRTSAVGLFPEGNSPFGVADLSGNVYEWCRSVLQEDVDKQPDFERRRILRGGSWRSYPGFLKNTSRYAAYPYLSTNYWGFRIVRVLRASS